MEDFKEIVYFAVSLIVAAFLITLIATLGLTTGQMASVRNGELLAAENLHLARKYSAYDNQLVLGSDVIALLRENAVDGRTLEIYVERDGMGVPMTMNAENSGDAVWRLSGLTQRIKADAVYLAVLVYDGENPITAVHSGVRGGTVTGVRFTAGGD
jgi:hypothetical protein